MDLVLEIQNLKILFDDEVAERKRLEEKHFFEISQLREEISDLKGNIENTS